MGWDWRSTGSFKFLFTLCEYRKCIGLLIYRFKNCHQHCYVFENWMQSWGVWIWFSKSQFQQDYIKIVQKVRCFKNSDCYRPFFENLMKLFKFQKKHFPISVWQRSCPNECLRSISGWWNESNAMWHRIKRSYKKINGKMTDIKALFSLLNGNQPEDIIHLILCFVNPADFVSDLLKKVVSNMRELKVLYCEEYDRCFNLV